MATRVSEPTPTSATPLPIDPLCLTCNADNCVHVAVLMHRALTVQLANELACLGRAILTDPHLLAGVLVANGWCKELR